MARNAWGWRVDQLVREVLEGSSDREKLVSWRESDDQLVTDGREREKLVSWWRETTSWPPARGRGSMTGRREEEGEGGQLDSG